MAVDFTWSLSGVDAHRWGLQSVSLWRPPVSVRRTTLEVPGRHGVIVAGLPVFEEPTVSLTMWVHGSTQDDIEDVTLELVGLLSAPGLTLTRTSGALVTSAPASLVSMTPDEFTVAAEATFEVVLAIPSVFLRGVEADSVLAVSGPVPGLSGSTGPVGDALVRAQGAEAFSITDDATSTGLSWTGSLPDDWFLYLDAGQLRAWVSQEPAAWDGATGTVVRTNLATNPSFEASATGTVDTPVVRENLHPNPRYIGTDGKLGGGSAAWPQSDFAGTGSATGDYDGREYSIIGVDSPQTGDVFIGTDSAANVPVQAGDTYTFSCASNFSTASSILLSVVVSWRDAADAEIAADIGAVDTLKAAWARRSVTATAPPNAAFAQVRLRIQMNPDGLVADDIIRITMRMVEHTAVLRPYFDGGSGPGDGPFFLYLDAHWTGPADASTSVLVTKNTTYPTTPRPLDFSAVDDADSVLGGGGAQAVPSTFGAQSGTTALAVVPNGFNADSRADVGATRDIPLEAGATYTVSGTVTLATAQEGTLTGRARAIVAVDSNDDGSGTAILATGTSAPNEAGSHRVSVTFTIAPGRSLVHLRLYNGSDLSTDVVWWDDLLIEKVGEAQAYFSGDTPDTLWSINAWTGPADDSTSTQTITPEVTSGLDYPAAGPLQLWPTPGTDPSVREASVTYAGASEVVVRARPAYL